MTEQLPFSFRGTGDPPRLGDRVVWRSGSHNFTAEKVGIVVFIGPSGWRPENAPHRLKYWLDKSWKDTVKERCPSWEELCRRFPDPDGRGQSRAWKAQRRMTSAGRYKFDKCASGIIVAVTEYRQLTFDTKKLTVKKPKKPTLYAPSLNARATSTGLKVWPVGARRPKFPKEPLGIWNFTVHYLWQEQEVLVQKGDQILFEGRGANQKAAKRECITRLAKETRLSRNGFKIRIKGIPADAQARRIDGAA